VLHALDILSCSALVEHKSQVGKLVSDGPYGVVGA